MARDGAYRKAEQRIEAARQGGATELDLSGMGLTEVPEAIGSLTTKKKSLRRSNFVYNTSQRKYAPAPLLTTKTQRTSANE